MAGDCGSACPSTYGFYSYDPNIGGNVVLLAAFAVLSLVVPYLGIRSWTPLFSVTLTTGLLAEVLGFVGRVLLHSTRDSQPCFFLSLLGTVLGPTLMSAAIFIILPHVLGIYGDPISPFKPLLTGLVFFTLISVALIIQLVGVIFVAYESHDVSRNLGAKIAAAGLAIQAVLLLACSALHFWFTLGLSTHRGSLDARHYQVYTSARFKRLIMGMELAIVLLVVYSVYRTIELVGGVTGSLFQNQVAFMVVGGALPCCAGVILTAFHPGPIFGEAWAETIPRGIKRHNRPSSIQHPNGFATHHRYDPNIRKQISPTYQRALRSSMSPPELPVGSPGLPASPRPIYKASSPRYTRIGPTPSPTSERPERMTISHPFKGMVNNEELW